MSTGPTPGRGIFSIGSQAPPEIRLAAWLLFTGGMAFLLIGVLRIPAEGSGSAEGLVLAPLTQLTMAIGIAGGLLHGSRLARLFGLVFVLLVALLHFSVLLQPFALWIRIGSGLIAASAAYVAVLLNTRPALMHTGGVRR
jgi:hypothetical protein